MAIGGTRIKFFNSSPRLGDRRPKYQISSRRERDLKDLLALSECRRERHLKDLLALSERRREQITRPLCMIAGGNRVCEVLSDDVDMPLALGGSGKRSSRC